MFLWIEGLRWILLAWDPSSVVSSERWMDWLSNMPSSFTHMSHISNTLVFLGVFVCLSLPLSYLSPQGISFSRAFPCGLGFLQQDSVDLFALVPWHLTPKNWVVEDARPYHSYTSHWPSVTSLLCLSWLVKIVTGPVFIQRGKEELQCLMNEWRFYIVDKNVG